MPSPSRVTFVLLVCALLALPALADSQARIVRLSDVQGSVQIDKNTGLGFESAFVNLPITQGTQVRTGDRARAEIEFEDGSSLRLTPNTTVEFSKLLVGQPFYGPVRANKSAEPDQIGNRSWSLWAGYCMYDFSVVKDLPMNFLYDFSRGLDTGGRNWDCLYKNYDRPRPVFADSRKIPLTDSRTGKSHLVRIVDRRWLHFRGASYRREVQEQLEMYERMANALAETGPETTTF